MESEKQRARKVWVSLQPVLQNFTKPYYSLVFSEISVPRTLRSEDVRFFVLSRLPPLIAECLIKTFLKSVEGAKVPYYDVTAQFRNLLDGDLQVAGKLRDRTIFCLFTEVSVGTEADATAMTNDANVDVLSSEGVEILIRRFFAPYASAFKNYLGNTILGFCIEPPDLLNCDVKHPLKLPWTPEFPDYLPEEGALMEKLPLLFYDTYESAAVQQDFWQSLTQKFAETCVARLREWCHEQKVKLALTQPIRARSFTQNSLPLFVESDVPGVHQVKSELQLAKRLVLLKHASSISEQFNKPHTLNRKNVRFSAQTELFRWLDELHWESIAGCNIFSLFSQNRRIIDNLEDYIKRLNCALSLGERCRQLLVVNPMSSLWVKFGGQDWYWIINELAYISEQLMLIHHDFDYADENLMVTHGGIYPGVRKFNFRLERARTCRLMLGSANYPVVLVPPCINLQSNTVELLKKFVSAKGKLIVCEPLPYLMDGMGGDYAYPLERLLHHRRASILRGSQEEKVRQLEVILDKIASDSINIYAKPENLKAKGIVKHHRKSENLHICLLLNTKEEQVEVLLEIDGQRRVEEWSLVNGEKFEPVRWHADNKTYVEMNFEAKMARLLVSWGI